MSQVENSLRGQLIPLAGMQLLLPTTSIAEIVDWQVPAAVTPAPDWLLGRLEWRGLQLPLISFEAACGRPRGEIGRRARIAVLNGIGGHPELPFYALQTEGIPHLSLVDEGNLEAITTPDEPLPLALGYAQLDGSTVVIPDLDALEALLRAQGLKVVEDDAA